MARKTTGPRKGDKFRYVGGAAVEVMTSPPFKAGRFPVPTKDEPDRVEELVELTAASDDQAQHMAASTAFEQIKAGDK